jgi:hypothetical protein
MMKVIIAIRSFAKQPKQQLKKNRIEVGTRIKTRIDGK